jgi:GH24 family phage-related lysozyme (muramidase)
MELVENFLTENPCYKEGKKIKVRGLMLHSVGCPQPSAEVFIKQWNNKDAKRACVHAFIDGNTAVVYQILPWDHKAWHCGGDANSTHIGVEMCEPACISYQNGTTITCSDTEAAMKVVKRTYDTAVELFAYLCKKFDLNPLEDGVIISHKEGHDRKIASGHGDPDHLWTGMHCEYTMDGFRKAVAETMKMDIVEKTVTEDKKAVDNTETTDNTEEHDAVSDKHVFCENDIVTLKPSAVYYSGGTIPDWVISDKWIVKSIKGDRAVLGSNVSKTHDITCPVNVKYLIYETSDTTETPVSGPVTENKQQPPTGVGEMEISDVGVELIAKYEGCRLEAYVCPAGKLTIGYGHTAGVKSGDTLSSEAEAKALLKTDLKEYGRHVNALVKNGKISFALNQNQFDALTSFCYNCGPKNLEALVSGRDEQTVAEVILKYSKGGGKVLPGLVRRREEERALFLKRG